VSAELQYTVVLEPNPEGLGFTVRVPALPGCITEGRSREEALSNAREAIEGFIEGLAKAGDPIPRETTPAELATVTIG
jgi:predicted RNase H-like HicB family nuclease